MTSMWRQSLAGALGPIALIGLLVSYATGNATAQEARPRALVILDGSGSMWGQIEGTPKIETAQAGLARLIDTLEGRADLGLMGFGNRRKSDCKDIDRAFPPGRIDAAAAKAWLGKFRPRGKTPMAASLKLASQALAAGGPGGHIVIVTDGADNCRADPCAVASEITAADPALRLHTIILGTTEENMQKTLCVAETGKGLVETVAKPSDFDPALDRIMAAIAGAPAPETGDAPVSAGPPGLRLSLRLGPGSAEVTEDISWTVTRDGTEVYKGSTPRPTLDLAPGTYTVTVTSSGITAEQTVDVGSEGPTATVLDLGAGLVRIALVAGAGSGSVEDAYYAIYRADPSTGAELETVSVGRGSPPPLVLKAGSYRAVFEQGLARIERALAVEAGGEIASDIAFDIGTLQVAARAVEGGPLLEDVYISVAEDDPEASGGRREVATSAAAEPNFTLRAGLYHLRVEHGSAVATAVANVRGGETTAQEVIVPSGQLTLTSRIAGSTQPIADLIAYRIESLEEGGKEATRLNGPSAVVTLAAGRYRVTSQYGTANARAQREVVVTAGAEETVSIDHEAGVVSFVIEGQTKLRNVQWTVKGGDGRQVWASADPAPEVPLGAGDYEVEARLAGKMLTGRFNVAPGEIKTVEIRPE